MKKIRLFSLILAGLLLVQSAALPAFAEPEETTVPAETTAPAATGETQVPEVTIPDNITGDASVRYGSKTLDAAYPLADTGDYSAEAKAALAYDLSSNTLIFAQNADEKLYPASLTKVMTALVVLEQLTDLQEVVTVKQSVIRDLEPGSSNAALKDGEEMSVMDLLYCLMIPSAGDAALVLAEHTAGSVDAFVELMNQKAAELGCVSTNFRNPHGLHDDEHYSTARDLAKIMMAALEYEAFDTIYSTYTYTIPATNVSETRELISTNYLMRNSGYLNVYDSRIIGGKTGYTSEAGRCLVAVSEKGGMKLLTVILGTNATYGVDKYTYLRYGNFEETSELMDFAYENYSTLQVLAANQIMCQFDVENGENDAFATVLRSVVSAVPVGSGVSALRYEYSLNDVTLGAPVTKNDEIGVVRVWLNNICIAQESLYAAASVEKAVVIADDDSDGEENGVIRTLLTVAVTVVAVVVIMMIVVRVRYAMLRSRRRRRRRSKVSASAGRSSGGYRRRQ